MKRATLRAIQPSHPLGYFGLDSWNIVHAWGMFDPAQLFLKGGNGKQLCSELRVIVDGEMVAAIFHETMDKMAREVVSHVLLGAQHHERFVEEQQGFAVLFVQFMEVNGGVGHHGGDIHLEPLVLMRRQAAAR